MTSLVFILIVPVSALLSGLLLRVAMLQGRRWGVMDKPDGVLKIQPFPIPRTGGLAVAAAFFFVAMSTIYLAYVNNWYDFMLSWSMLASLAAMGLLTLNYLLLGLVDDVWGLRPMEKFVAQWVIGLLGLYLFGLCIGGILKLAFWVFLLVAAVNAFNLIDVSDGLSSSVGVAAAAGIAFLLWTVGLVVPALLALNLIGALLGFYYFNRQPAKVYLGDAGAFWLGACLVALLMLVPWRTAWLALLCPIIFLGVPLAECVGLVTIRSYLGRPFYLGSRHHFSHYLQRRGWTQSQVSLLGGGAGLTLAAVGNALFWGVLSVTVVLPLLIVAFAAWNILIYVGMPSLNSREKN